MAVHGNFTVLQILILKAPNHVKYCRSFESYQAIP